VPYQLVVGPREVAGGVASGRAAVRLRDGSQAGEVPIEQLAAQSRPFA
jgi:threonyl-tRNA synthetase